MASAFVPGHVTAFFSAHRRDDPARTGSRGGGLCLSDGVTVTVEPAPETRVTLDGDPVAIAPVEAVLADLGVTAAVRCRSDPPVGTGFGVSGAAALGTALAADAAFDCGGSENDLVEAAHVAEVEAGTGLGDVVAQARGGMPLRVAPGAPGHGEMDGIPASGRVEYVSLGGLSTAEVIGGDTTRLSAAGERALAAVREDPRPGALMAAARQFARDADLLTPRVERVIDDVIAAGGEAAMAMLGETVFALDTGLSDAGYDPRVCRIHHAGAHLR